MRENRLLKADPVSYKTVTAVTDQYLVISEEIRIKKNVQ